MSGGLGRLSIPDPHPQPSHHLIKLQSWREALCGTRGGVIHHFEEDRHLYAQEPCLLGLLGSLVPAILSRPFPQGLS